MTSFKEILKRTFGSKPLTELMPSPAPIPEPPPAPPSPEKMPGKSMDIQAVAEAQRIYNPQIPPMAPKPTEPKDDQGTVRAMDVGGTWGAPETKS